jgi:ribosomal protein S18 acetylase RimI-like enzyme
MGWIESIGGVGQLTDSVSESEQFGLGIGRLTIGSTWQKDCATSRELREYIEEVVGCSPLDDIILRAPSNLAGLINQSHFGTRRTYAAGTLLYWEKQAQSDWPRPSPPPRDLRIASFAEEGEQESTLAEAMHVLENTFQGYQNHYASNPALPDTAATDAYRNWAAHYLRTSPDSCYLGRVDSKLAGIVITTDLGPGGDSLEILLAGVHSNFRNRGIYTAMLSSAIADAGERGRSQAYISTQAHNVASQRAWAFLGFKPCYSVDTFHLQKDSRHAS